MNDKVIFEKYIVDQIDLVMNKNNVSFHIAFAISNNFFRPLGVLITSIVKSNPSTQLSFHIFTSGVDEENLERLKIFHHTHKVNIYIYTINDEVFSTLNTKQFTIAAYYRFLIPIALRQKINKVLYLDADMICIGCLKPMIEMDFRNKIACVVKDEAVTDFEKLNLRENNYFNSGMLYIDIEKWNNERITEKCLALLNKRSYEFSCFDQDALNIVLEGKVRYISRNFNFLCNLSIGACKKVDNISEDIVFVHYIGFNKPWHKWCFHPFKKYFCSSANISLWKDIPLDENPKTYRQMRMFAKFYFNDGQYFNSLLWLVKSGWIKLKK